jgi:S-DNA-T family DNA segregation ATPase FtsK/SpoIIIE
MIETISKVFSAFKVHARIVEEKEGPSFNLYKIKLGLGQEFSKLKRIEKNIAAACLVSDVRVFGPIAGCGLFGLEVAKNKRDIVNFHGLVSERPDGELPVVLGVDSNNEVLVEDLTKMPHLLIAGATGSGKSVCLNTIIQSIIKFTPDTRLVLLDPKRVEFAEYKNHPNVHERAVESRDCVEMLSLVVDYMEHRYRFLEEQGEKNMLDVRNKGKFHAPYYVIVIDELSDLMMVSKGEVESYIVRIAQLARAAGIHLVIGTQRPTTNVVTGLIKSNIPARIAFQVTSKIDSRVILDESGAEVLLGMGDGIYYDGKGKKTRFQGAFI